MALCDLCQTISFTSLPSVPEGSDGFTCVADNSDMPELMWPRETKDKPSRLKGPIGFAWHKCLDALAESAKAGCPLCALVQIGVQRWLDHYHEAEISNPSWVKFNEDRQPIPAGEVLWLTKRLTGEDGFIVVVRNPKEEFGLYFLTGVNFSVDSDSDLASKFPLRPIDQDSGSLRSLEVAATLLQNCLEKHEECPREDTPLPSRVLDVGSIGDTIKLIDCPDGSTGKYISLSHCWGSSNPLTTTRESYENRLSGISLSDLPKTFLDAVIIARHLGIRYIWIDSLCIMQEDKDDWARESARMTDVYSNAHLVISANRAEDGDAGCFHSRPARPNARVTFPGIGEICVQLLYPKEQMEGLGPEFEGEPLSGRGWALQERVLARRVLHYNNRQILIECNNGILGEDGCRFEDRYCCKLADLKQPKASHDKQHHHRSSHSPEHSMWNHLLWAYGQRKLTKATDKLPAVSGLAKLFKSRISAEYVAGLWSDSLIEELAWQGIGDRMPNSTTEYTGPSWSWASYGGLPATGRNGEWKDIAKVEDWHVELENEGNPFGEVKNAWIRIHAPIAELKLSEVSTIKHEFKLKELGRTPLPRFRTRYSNDEVGKAVTLDHQDILSSGGWREWNLQVIILCWKLSDADDEGSDDDEEIFNEEGDSMTISYGLVVTRVEDGEESRLKRVGWMFLEAEETKKLLGEKENWRSVTLV